MKDYEIIEQHELIRETIGYKFISKVNPLDIPGVLKFLRIVVNYKKMKQHESK